MRIAIITANLGNFDLRVDPVEQSMPADFFRFTDDNFPPRKGAMTSRLQARICKTFGWQMVPGYDVYIWIDGGISLKHPDSVKWLVEQCSGDIAVFKHPNRNTVKDEAKYLKERLAMGCDYIVPRYENELIDEQLEAIKDLPDEHLFASGILVYKNNDKIHEMMKEWWFHISRYHLVDQLALPYSILKTGCEFTVIPNHYGRTPYLTLNKRNNNENKK